MSNHEINLNTNLSEPPRTRADFTEITPTVISIFDTGLGKCPVSKGHRSGLTQDRIPGIDQLIQDHVPGRQRILARGSVGW
jgi:hypothetical protein